MKFTEAQIARSIRTQDHIFFSLQPYLLNFLNSDAGKYLLWKKTGHLFPNKIVQVSRNTIHEHLENTIFRGTFFSRQPLANMLLPLIEKVKVLQTKYMPVFDVPDAMAFYAGLSSKRQYPRIYDEEIYRGFNPLLFRYLYNHPQFRGVDFSFNSAAGSNSPVDGFAGRLGQNDTFTNIRSGAGNDHDDSGANLTIDIDTQTGSNFGSWTRCFTLFDTASLSDTDTILSAKLSLYGNFKNNGHGSPDLHVGASTPASSSGLANSDYGNVGTTSFGFITYAGFVLSTMNDINFNGSGIAAISKTGISQFSLQLNWDIENNYTGDGTDSTYSQIQTYAADNGSTIPALVVTYVDPDPTGRFNQGFSTNIGRKDEVSGY